MKLKTIANIFLIIFLLTCCKNKKIIENKETVLFKIKQNQTLNSRQADSLLMIKKKFRKNIIGAWGSLDSLENASIVFEEDSMHSVIHSESLVHYNVYNDSLFIYYEGFIHRVRILNCNNDSLVLDGGNGAISTYYKR